LGQRHEGLEAFEQGINLVADLLEQDPNFSLFLETPRIAAADKKSVIRKAFEGAVPAQLLNFLLIAIDKRRQRLLRDISVQYSALLDEHEGRAHVEVTLARPMDDETKEVLAQRLSGLVGKTAIPHVRVRPEILGGIIVRTGDTIYDGSVRRRLDGMRRQLLKAKLPSGRAG
jgi:F-type H+-transporting ATPase subunit delta